MIRDLVAGIDSSTQSCTVVARRLDDGAVVVEARPHPSTTPPAKLWKDPQSAGDAEWLDALLPAAEVNLQNGPSTGGRE